MNQAIIKNIGIMRQLIEIGDTDTLSTILTKTKEADNAQTFKYLWNALDNQRFDDALILIEDAERQARQVVVQYNPIVSALKVELHFQENELAFLVADRDEMVKKIEQFEIRYTSVMGDLLDEMLFLRKEKLAIQAKMDKRLQKQFEEAEAEYNSFHEAHKSPIKGILYALNEDEQRELKTLYRRASMICHPDRVADDYKEKAVAMFTELHEAYLSNDIKKMRILTELLEKTGQFEPKSNYLDTAEALKAQIDWVVSEKEKTEEEIQHLHGSQAYFTVESVGENWMAYLNNLAENMKNQIGELKKWHLLHSTQN
jgi:ribosome-binding protein aMBF1 (putative translation factor)